MGEEKTFSEIVEIVEIAQKSNSLISRLFEGNRILLETNEDIRTLEKQADRLSFRVKEDIVNGAVNPNILDDLLECVELADGMVDSYYFVSREIKRMECAKFGDDFDGKLPELDSTFSKMLDLIGQALSLLARILRATKNSEFSELRSDIQLLEEEGDNIKDSGFDNLYAAAPSIHYLQFSHASELLHKFDDILDSCEDIADLVVEITTSVSR